MHWLFLIAPVCLDFSEGKAVTLNSGSCINNRLNQKQKSFNHASHGPQQPAFRMFIVAERTVNTGNDWDL